MTHDAQLLIIGAGPFGLGLAAEAARRGVDYTMVGRPMDFWRSHMPAGMYLRSDSGWHLDPADVHTIEHFLDGLGLTRAEAEPLSLEVYLRYAEWFRQQKGIEPRRCHVTRLDRDSRSGRFVATLDDGGSLTAAAVVIALGAGYFSFVPEEVEAVIPPDRYTHTRDAVDFSGFAGQRVLIVGGRQSAFEWAALMQESGAERVNISYRHATPSFTHAEWGWVDDLVRSIGSNPGWYRGLGSEEKESLKMRLWAEGRLKLEPWLVPRIPAHKVKQFPGTLPAHCTEVAGDRLHVVLSDGTRLEVDRVVLATGYRVDVARVPFLTAGNVFGQIAIRDGYPVLSDEMESTVPGLYFTSSCAVGDFGPFFGFTVAVRTAAQLIGAGLSQKSSQPASA
jgi:cation diffusion facilitator CzcD-associated flavoprotein CzcO